MLVNYVNDSILLLLLLGSQEAARLDPGSVDLGPQMCLVVSPSNIKRSRYSGQSAFLVRYVEAWPIGTLKLFHKHRSLSLGAFIYRLVLRAHILLLFINLRFLKLLQNSQRLTLLNIGQVVSQGDRLVHESLLDQRFRAINLVTLSGIMVSGMLGSYRTLQRFDGLFFSLRGLRSLASLRNNHGLKNVFVRTILSLLYLPQSCNVGCTRPRQLVLPDFAGAWLQVLSYLMLLLIYSRLLHATNMLFDPGITFTGHSLIVVDSPLSYVQLALGRFIIWLWSNWCAHIVFHESSQIRAILLSLKCPRIASGHYSSILLGWSFLGRPQPFRLEGAVFELGCFPGFSHLRYFGLPLHVPQQVLLICLRVEFGARHGPSIFAGLAASPLFPPFHLRLWIWMIVDHHRSLLLIFRELSVRSVLLIVVLVLILLLRFLFRLVFTRTLLPTPYSL